MSKAYTEVCLPTLPSPWGWLEVPGGYNHPRGKEKGEDHDSSSEKAAYEATEAGWKEYREENWQIHRGPQDPQFPSLSPIKLTIYPSKKIKQKMDLEECLLLCFHIFEIFQYPDPQLRFQTMIWYFFQPQNSIEH